MRKIFLNEEITRLSKNPYVFRCTEKSIIYTYEFKKRALELRTEGVSSRDIWRRAGIDISRWKKDYCKDTIKDWKRIVRKKGIESLANLRVGRPKTKGVSEADRIKRLELQVRYLEAENDFLVKLRAKRAESNSGQRKNTK